MDTLIQIILRSLETGSIYALAALGIIIIYRTSTMTNFSQGTMGMFNAFIATTALIKFNLNPWIAVLVGIVGAFIVGILVDLLIIRQSTKVSPLGKQIITMGMVTLFLGLAPLLFGVEPLSFPRLFLNGDFSIGKAAISYNSLFNIAVGVLIAAGLYVFLQKTKWGLAVRVTASNETTARLMGVPTSLITMGAWAVASTLGALSALMIAPTVGVTVGMMDSVQINSLIATVLGGFQTFYGPVLGAYIISIVKNLNIIYISSVWGEQITYIMILLFITIRPNGLVGKKLVKKV